MTNKKEIKAQLKKLLEAERSILYKIATDTEVSEEHLNKVIMKMFELSDLILRLKNALAEIRKNEF